VKAVLVAKAKRTEALGVRWTGWRSAARHGGSAGNSAAATATTTDPWRDNQRMDYHLTREPPIPVASIVGSRRA